MNNKKITISGLIIAIYIVIMYMTQGFAFGQYQIRVATALYSLAYIYPFLALPLAIANSLSNVLMGGLGFIDIVGGFIVGLTVSKLIVFIKYKKLNRKLIALPIIAIGLIVPIWLSFILQLPYYLLAVNIIIGQVPPAILGVVLVENLLCKQLPLRNNDIKEKQC